MLGFSTAGAKAIAIGLLFLVIAGAIGTFIMHERAVGAEGQIEKQAKWDQSWMQGAIKNADDVDAKWRGYVNQLFESEKSRAQQKEQSVRLSVANDARVCFDPAAAERLSKRGAIIGGGAADFQPGRAATASGTRH
jgi:hypothetical protein